MLGAGHRATPGSADLSLPPTGGCGLQSGGNDFLSLMLSPSEIAKVTVKTRSDLPLCTVSKPWVFMDARSMD